jgi:hypothetical protein
VCLIYCTVSCGNLCNLWCLVSVDIHIVYHDLMMLEVQGQNWLPHNKIVLKCVLVVAENIDICCDCYTNGNVLFCLNSLIFHMFLEPNTCFASEMNCCVIPVFSVQINHEYPIYWNSCVDIRLTDVRRWVAGSSVDLLLVTSGLCNKLWEVTNCVKTGVKFYAELKLFCEMTTQ